ncbi:MAG: type II toxin-antitoxin system VapC family toxin [Candidatus Poribacteria bacterium]|nr:type II toxin-antitoxin system VapC family toxin [Candidatus Poribacteria bacterium]
MNYFWLDASAVVKRYITEVGTANMQYFFTHVRPDRMIICRPITVGEVISIFVRRKNSQQITAVYFNQIKQLFQNEIRRHPDILKILPTEIQEDASVEFIEAYSINSTDALILQCAIDKTIKLQMNGNNLVLVSSDKRLLRAAQSEELLTFNPETDNQAALDVLIDPP